MAAYIGDGELEETVFAAQQRLGCWVCATDGAAGTFWTDGGPVKNITSPNIEVVDTLGAGDVWHGVFALMLAEGMKEEEAVLRANAAAALKCTQFGGRDGTPNRAQTDHFLKEWN